MLDPVGVACQCPSAFVSGFPLPPPQLAAYGSAWIVHVRFLAAATPDDIRAVSAWQLASEDPAGVDSPCVQVVYLRSAQVLAEEEGSVVG
jgi:hypothetical protein